MKLPFAGRLRRMRRGRDFLQSSPDVKRVFMTREPSLKNRSGAPSPLSPAQLEHWNDFGFLVLRGFFAPSVLDAYKRHIGRLWQTRTRLENPLVIYTNRGGHYFRDAIDNDRLQTYRLLDQYLIDEPTRELCMDQRLTRILHQLMGYAPVVCNTLLFEWGSEQDMHSDMFYMAPESENQMLATWMALDDVTDDNGPLLYVPGSHKLPPHHFSHGKVQAVTDEVPDAVAATRDKMHELGLRTEKFYAERGDVLIWHSQLVHGGDLIRDRTVRRLCAERNNGSFLLVKEHVPVGELASG